MNDQEFLAVVDDCTLKCKKILNKKGKDYSSADNRFSNFEAAAGLQSSSTKQALFGMLAKHLVAINDFIDNDAEGEVVLKKDWESKIFDAINYLYLLYGVLVEEEKV